MCLPKFCVVKAIEKKRTLFVDYCRPVFDAFVYAILIEFAINLSINFFSSFMLKFISLYV